MDDRETLRRAIIDYCSKNEFFSGIKNLEKKVDAWLDAYPIDILAEIKKMNAWLISKGRRYRNYARFINDWLSRSSGAPIARPPSLEEVMSRVSYEVDMKTGLGKQMTPRKQATIEELQRQAKIILEREQKEKEKNQGANHAHETEK